MLICVNPQHWHCCFPSSNHKAAIFFLQSPLHWPILKTALYSSITLRIPSSTENKQTRPLRSTKKRMVTLPLSEWTRWRELWERWVFTNAQLEPEAPGSDLAGTNSLTLHWPICANCFYIESPVAASTDRQQLTQSCPSAVFTFFWWRL